MVTVLHAADFHLDSAFGGLTETQAAARRAENRKTVERLVDYANDHGAELLLLAGDLFDSDALYAQTAGELAAALGRFHGQVVMAPGNHDYYTPASPYARQLWPDNVHIFTGAAVECFAFPEYGCRVYGAAFTAPECLQGDTLSHIRTDGEWVNIGLLHGDVGVRDSRYRPIALAEIRESALDYLALGHVHSCSGVETAGQTAWAYPGCPEGRGFDETGEKGFLFGTVDHREAHLRFVPFAQRRYAVLEVDITDREPLRAIEAALPPRTQEDIYRITLCGEVDTPPVLQELQDALQQRFFALELRDKTTAKEDLWAHRGEDTLRGLFLQELYRRYEQAADDTEKKTAALAARFGIDAMDNRER